MDIDINEISTIFLSYLPYKRRSTPSNWTSLNCPFCMHNGEPTPDTKQKGGLRLEAGGFVYHCFRCKWVVSWQPGQKISEKLIKTFKWLGVDDKELLRASILALEIRNIIGAYSKTSTTISNLDQLPATRRLPKEAKSIASWFKEPNIPPELVSVLEYMMNRNPLLMQLQEFYWSPETINDLNKRIIIPIKYANEIIGWTARWAANYQPKDKAKYYTESSPNILFNWDHIENPNRKFIVVNEGPLDAIVTSGVAILGDTFRKKQIEILKKSNKEIILFPDRDKSGEYFLEVAKENHWYVSIPNWRYKDAEEASRHLGRLYVIKKIIELREDDHLKYRLKYKLWC